MRSVLARSVIAAGVLALPMAAAPALAAGDDGGTTTQCTGGRVWDQAQGKCVEQQSRGVDSESIYQQGRALAEAGRHDEAIRLLGTLAGNGDPRVLNYLGYAHRMEGRVTVALGYYLDALDIDPDFKLARAYMGEAYLRMGDIASALEQLSQIEARCGTDCREYAELDARIAEWRAGG